MITYIHFPTPDNKKPIHDFINSKAPYGTTISDDLSTVTTQVKYYGLKYNSYSKNNCLPFLLDKDNPNQSTLQHLSEITLGDFFTNNLFEPKDTYQWLLTYWDSEGTHLVALYNDLEKTCQEALNFNHKLTKIIAIPSNQSLDITI